MSEILIFGGTTEGRLLAEFCAQNELFVDISVTTDYGAELLPKSSFINVLNGKLDEAEIAALIKSSGYKLIIDATHPYATAATQNIKAACSEANAEYLRLIREKSTDISGRTFADMNELIRYLNGSGKRVLSALGSKELPALKNVTNYRDRIWARVLPADGIEEYCRSLGFANIIVGKGPFSEEENVEHIRKSGAEIFVTKESGAAGGFPEKVSAAEKCGAELAVLLRPAEKGNTLLEIEKILLEKKMISIIGIGMDGEKTLTAEALSAIKKADIIIGAKRMTEPFESLGKPCFCSWKSEEIADFLRNEKYENAAVLMSGDCGFYSGAEKLLHLIKDVKTTVISGISSPVYFCSKIKKTWKNMKFVSLHGEKANIVRNVRRNELCFFLLGGEVTPDKLCRRLCEYGMGETKVYIGENLAAENERILTGKASDFTDVTFGKLTVAVTENTNFEKKTAIGINDEKFTRGKVPMTKSEVRSAVISKLEISRCGVCWDVGCGTGSVSVEAALQCFDGTVYAVDKNSEAVELTRENAHKFGCDNIEIICGSAPDCLSDFPAPDSVFIGGSSGRINEISDIVFAKNPNAVIVVTAVSVETLNEAVKALEQYEIEPEIVQLAVTRTRKIGLHTMFSAENPVFIIKGAKR